MSRFDVIRDAWKRVCSSIEDYPHICDDDEAQEAFADMDLVLDQMESVTLEMKQGIAFVRVMPVEAEQSVISVLVQIRVPASADTIPTELFVSTRGQLNTDERGCLSLKLDVELVGEQQFKTNDKSMEEAMRDLARGNLEPVE